MKVTIETISHLARHQVGLVSITENIDYSNPQGILFTQMLGAFAEYYSGALSTHVKKGITERAHNGMHLGGIPFGYESCQGNEATGKVPCHPEHPGGVHVEKREGEVIRELFRRYSTGTVTLSQLASWLNGLGFRTRNMHSFPDIDGNMIGGPRLFTVASLRVILHNPFYIGKIKFGEQLLPGAHKALISEELFQTVQIDLRHNSGRSETLNPHPQREYLLKGIIRCAHCGLPMWAETYKNGHRYYREHLASRGSGNCVAKSGSIPCDIPDEQMGRIVGALVLPEVWLDRVLAKVHMVDEAQRVRQEMEQVQQRLKRLARAYVDGLYSEDDYRREKRQLEDRLAGLVVPAVDAAHEAGKLLENLPQLWEKANLSERRKLLLAMLDEVYSDAVETKSIVAITPKPAFRALFDIVTTREASGVVLVTEPPEKPDGTKNGPPDNNTEVPANPCLWWRRGGPQLHDNNPSLIAEKQWGAMGVTRL